MIDKCVTYLLMCVVFLCWLVQRGPISRPTTSSSQRQRDPLRRVTTPQGQRKKPLLALLTAADINQSPDEGTTGPASDKNATK